MSKKQSKLKLAQQQAEKATQKTNEKIEELGTHTSALYTALNTIQRLFDEIRNVPPEQSLKYEKLKKIRVSWKKQADQIEADYKMAVAKNAGKGAAGIGAGVAVVALGPAAAMGIATTFGVASTGTAISALSGAAATNAALAWLGGGALVAGGGGMMAGNAFLALAGPIGWTIAGVALASSGFVLWKTKQEQNRLEDIFTLISKRDMKKYELAIVEINERIQRIKQESTLLNEAIELIETFGKDYTKMTDSQQFQLGSYVNLMESSTQLLVNPILGLQPQYSEEDWDRFIERREPEFINRKKKYKTLVINLANLFYKITLTTDDKKILFKSLSKNKEFLKAMNISKEAFDESIFGFVFEFLTSK